MFTKLVPVTRQRHQNITLSPVLDYRFSASLHTVPLAIVEFPAACVHLPIVFLEEKEKMFPHLMLGLQPGRNLCIDDLGAWIAGYMPLAVRRYPFSFVRSKEGQVLCIDEKCGLFTERTGQTLFDVNGKQGPDLVRAVELLQTYQNGIKEAGRFCAILKEYDLFAPLKIRIAQKDGTEVLLKGIYIINEKKLQALPDDQFLQLRYEKIIPFIYYHLLSLQNVNLLQVKNRNLVRESLLETDARIPDSFTFGG